MKQKELNFFGSLKLLEACVDAGVLHTSPDDPDDILVYRMAGDDQHPEGWYATNAHTLAQELMNDADEQKILLNALEEKGVSFQTNSCYFKKERAAELEL